MVPPLWSVQKTSYHDEEAGEPRRVPKAGNESEKALSVMFQWCFEDVLYQTVKKPDRQIDGVILNSLAVGRWLPI